MNIRGINFALNQKGEDTTEGIFTRNGKEWMSQKELSENICDDYKRMNIVKANDDTRTIGVIYTIPKSR